MLWSRRAEAAASPGPGYAPEQFERARAGDTAPLGAGISNQTSDAAQPMQTAAPQASAEAAQFALAFTRIVSVLMRTPSHRHAFLADLEWMVLPAIATGQFAILDATIEGNPVPVAAAFWACVSPDVDQRLSDLSVPLRLRPDEWRSGDIVWLVDAMGEAGAVKSLLVRLANVHWADQQIKMRHVDPDGSQRVTSLSSLIVTK